MFLSRKSIESRIKSLEEKLRLHDEILNSLIEGKSHFETNGGYDLIAIKLDEISQTIDELQAALSDERVGEILETITREIEALKRKVEELEGRSRMHEDQIKSLFECYQGLLPEGESVSISRAVKVSLNPTSLRILALVKEGFDNTRAIRERLLQEGAKFSREYIARTLKKLSDMGLLERDEAGRPYRYRLTRRGEEELALAKTS